MRHNLSESNRYTVVIADDNVVLRRIVARALDATKFFRVVGEASDGNEAITVVAQHQPDVLILDMQMPLRNGLEALPSIREAAPDTYIAIFSGIAPEILTPAATMAGAHLYLEKSCPVGDFVTELLEAVSDHEARRFSLALESH